MDKQLENPTDNCPVCRSSDIFIFLDIARMPAVCNRLWPTREEALKAVKGNMRLAFCRTCSHVFNSAFDADLVEYSTSYENSLHYSSIFQTYARTLAMRLIQKYDLYNKDIIEIGCGKGDFLKLICELGDNRAIGFDPSYEENRADLQPGSHFSIVRDFYSQQYAHYKADIICCRHVLEHVFDPRQFISGIRRTIDNGRSTIVFFEVPNVMYTLKDLGIWDLLYEHCSFYNSLSLARVFSLCGFEVLELEDAFQGQILCIEARPGEFPNVFSKDCHPDFKKIEKNVRQFAQQYQNKVAEWQKKLQDTKHQKKSLVVWGAGSKGITFLNTVKGAEEIEFVVDINPHKHGLYVPGSGQKIVSSESLRRIRPDKIIVMNPIYYQEIQQHITGMKLSCELITA